MIRTTCGVTIYQSVKMRVADEVKNSPGKYCYGPRPGFLCRLTASHLAALSIWSLITQGHTALQRLYHEESAGIRMGMTLGIPMSFYTDADLRKAFLTIARVAWSLFRESGLTLPPKTSPS